MKLQHHHLVLVIIGCFTVVSFYKVISTDKGDYYSPTTSFATSTKILDVDVCRSLFTINGVPSKNVFRHVATNTTPGAKPRAVVSYGEEEISAAARGVRHLVDKRASSSGPDTDDYRVLGALLPKLVSFEHLQGEGEAPAGTKQAQPRPHVRGGSRIDAGGGVLPFVPCVIAPYDQPTSFAACVKRRLARKGSFWIYFMGDSKIRDVFLQLLDRTDKIFHYRIECKNETMTFTELDRRMGEVRWEDMEAATPLFPGLRVTNSFSMFDEHQPSKFPKSKELRQLQRWSEGAEDLPDLLIVGYTSWMLQHTRLYNIMSRSLHDVLAMMLEMHRYVVPRLEKISKATRVIVLSQSRQRPHSPSKFNARATFNNANFEWSELTFLHFMRAYREGRASVPRDGQQAETQHSEHGPNRQGSFDRVHSLKAWQSTHTQDRGVPRSKEQQDKELHSFWDDHRPGHNSGTFRDHLIPGTSTPGLWWWDSSLPINLAEIDECNELHRRDLTSDVAYGDPPLVCRDKHHAGPGTSSDLTTMLLNLACNSVLGMSETFCCT